MRLILNGATGSLCRPSTHGHLENGHLFRILLVVFAAAAFIFSATVSYSAQEKVLVERRKLSNEDDAILGAMSLRAILRLVKVPGREFRFEAR